MMRATGRTDCEIHSLDLRAIMMRATERMQSDTFILLLSYHDSGRGEDRQ